MECALKTLWNALGALLVLEVLQSGILQQYGVKRVGLAAHPEGSCLISLLFPYHEP